MFSSRVLGKVSVGKHAMLSMNAQLLAMALSEVFMTNVCFSFGESWMFSQKVYLFKIIAATISSLPNHAMCDRSNRLVNLFFVSVSKVGFIVKMGSPLRNLVLIVWHVRLVVTLHLQRDAKCKAKEGIGINARHIHSGYGKIHHCFLRLFYSFLHVQHCAVSEWRM